MLLYYGWPSFHQTSTFIQRHWGTQKQQMCAHRGRLGAQGGESKAKSVASAEANELMPWLSSGFHNSEKRNNCCLSHPTCSTLLWQPFIQLRPLESIYSS